MAHRETKLTNAESETGKQNKYLVTYLVDKSENLDDRVGDVTYNPLFVEINGEDIRVFENSFVDPRDNLKYKLIIW